ncbi:hypothetical protein BGZ80_003470 [Entomortierella chlamydospora]|uniref:Ankyrin repeat protein n=1 Tax=Entomortierella chlamydospora TaxID=101097 RepID=A0A9P6N257_9FUNG|nr:hypothetical protein BGZ79_006784 [Entomortierella chlamydospora]KAG0020849.1 hypothetical protein BGZ80_003470 [Entomortierella chlamydospora]
MSSARSKKQDSLQELRTGTVQRLSQQFLQASIPQAASKPPSSPIRYQPLAIPHTFKIDNFPPPPRPSLPSSTSSTVSSSSEKYSSPSISPLSSIRSNGGSTTPTPESASVQIRQQSGPQFIFRSASPTANHPSPPSSSKSTLPSSNCTASFTNSKDIARGLSLSSVGSEDSYVCALSYIDSPKEPGSPRTVPLWKQMLSAIEQEDRAELDRILHAFDFAIVVQTLVTWNLSNTDNKYRHDPDVLLDAKELLGPTVDHLNLIQIACFLFNEEMALDMLNFVAKASEELESKKILYEFMGKMWGDGNTTLHLASFLGMADLTKRLLDLGANVYKMNDRKYKPVDCADENTTMSLFLNLTEGDSGSELNWGSFRSLGHLRSTSTSTLPLLTMGSDDRRQSQNGEGSNNSDSLGPLLRSASTLGIASQFNGLLASESKRNESQELRVNTLQDAQTGSAACVDEISLTESNTLQVQEEESVLSPMATFKSTGLLNNVPSIPDSSGTSPSKSVETGAAIPSTNNERADSSDSRLPLQSVNNNSSYASHIRPTLRSYQSSPSIRLCIDKSVAKESTAPSISKKSKSGKRVSFDPHSLMADASRTGDLALYKSMLEIVQKEGKSGTLEEIINHQSASRKLSSLHLAASYNHLALCKFLVEMGADVNLTDMEGWTPMHCAAAEGHLNVFEFLVTEPDADLQATTLDGELFEDVVEDEELRQKIIDC